MNSNSAKRAPQQTPNATLAVPIPVSRQVNSGSVQPVVADTAQIVSPAKPMGSQDTVSPVQTQVLTNPFGQPLVLLTGKIQPVINRKLIFRRASFYGIGSFAFGIPTANQNPVYVGFEQSFLAWQVQPWSGVPALVLEAPQGHVYDLNQIFASGTTGDQLFFYVE